MAKIAFVGLGHMGLPMALNLIKAGHAVTGFDLQPTAVQALVQAGGKSAPDFADHDVVISMLQTGEQVQKLCLGEQGLFAQLQENTLYIDCSSIDVKTSQAITKAAYASGLMAVDAPVSGGVAGAQAATLTFMVGGEVGAFEKVQPILSVMGSRVIHAGGAGMGQAAKICNNMILGISMIAVSEAFLLAAQLGLSAKKLFDVVSVSSGQCWVMNQYVPVKGVLPQAPAEHDYQPGFTVAMMLKDLKLSQAAAADVGIETTLGAQAAALYETWHEQGADQLDFSSIIQLCLKLCNAPPSHLEPEGSEGAPVE